MARGRTFNRSIPTKISVEVEYENVSQKKVHTYDWLKDTRLNASDKQHIGEEFHIDLAKNIKKFLQLG